MKYLKELEKGFFAFWVLRYKVTYLLAFIIFIFGVFSLNEIPKESDPQVNLPRVTITTKYDGVSAVIIDDEITEEIEKSLEDIEGISSMNSTSSEGNSSITIEIDDGYDIDEVIDEIENEVDSTNLPSGIDDDYPKVVQREFTSTDMFSTILYASEKQFSFEDLLDLAENVKQNTSGNSGIKEVTIDTNTLYDIRIILSKEKLDNLGLKIDDISSAISNNDIDSPIGTYEIDGTKYSFKLSGEIKEYNELLNLDIFVNSNFIKLGDIAELELYYGDEKINKFGKYNDSGYLYISLIYSKSSGANIFDIAPGAKQIIEEELEKSIYNGVELYYTDDESQNITDDFSDLGRSAMITLFLVFISLIFFVGLRESVIATSILPLAFLFAFIIVNYIGETLNQITSFAFVLAFGIAIDTIIIIIEGAAEKVKQGYTPKTAILISLKEFRLPIVIGTVTTMSAFIPILTLPGMMGIFLSFIPLIVFITLGSTLFVSLVIAGAIFKGLSKNKNTYEVFDEREKVMSNDEKQLLDFERTGKTKVDNDKKGLRDKIYDKYSIFYRKFLVKILKNGKNRFLSIVSPIILLIVLIFTIAPNLGFEIFPSGVRDSLKINVTGPEEYIPSDMEIQLKFVEDLLSNTKEIKDYTLSISNNKISASMNLTPSIDRENTGEMANDKLQTFLTDAINDELSSIGFTVGASKSRRGPGGGDPVGVYIISSNAENFNDMVELASDFENYLFSLDEVSDVNLTSSSTIGEIEFSINTKQAAILGLTEKDIFNQISTAIRGKTVGSIKGVNNDHDIKLYFDTFLYEVKPSDIENINIYVGGKIIKAGSLIEYKITKTSPSIKRGDGDIQVGISASLLDSSTTSEVQAKFEEYAKNYEFPKGISYKKGGENEENSDLINSVLMGIFITFFLIFAVLVYQFNSYGQPAVILYSVFMSIIGVIIGLYLTGNPLSMPVGVGFISLMGIVVNDAIIMIDKFNNNLGRGMELKTAIVEGAVSRLNPILVTTLTTSAGIIPIALQDAFWSGLGFTIAFGLTTGSLMTLFAIPTLYYAITPNEHKNEEKVVKKEKSKGFIRRHLYKIIGTIIFIITTIIFFFGLEDSNTKNINQDNTQIKELMKKARSGEELTEQEKKIIQEFREKNQDNGGKGGMRKAM